MNLRETIPTRALRGISAATRPAFPQCFTELPLVTWALACGRCVGRADGQEYLTELQYVVDVWAKGVEAAATLADEVAARMAAAGLRQTDDRMLYDSATGLNRRRMVYRCVVDGGGRVYP